MEQTQLTQASRRCRAYPHLVQELHAARRRDVLILRSRGLSVRAISDRTGIPRSTVHRIITSRGA
ncbi:MAG: helix-turn-helix domain-containing protein [Microthrixaceae bacterium]|nr:helix-turn-helix domain-containing protein [Microthrixaceae bacterium]